MKLYVAQRAAAFLVLLFAISIIVFLAVRLVPGDPAEVLLGTNAGDAEIVDNLREQLGLNQPITTQYFVWAGNALQGDFGYSYGQQRSVTSLVSDNLWPTLQLMSAALLLTLIFGTALGVMAGMRRGSRFDVIAMGLAITMLSIPGFWLGLILLIIFAVQFPVFDVIGGPGLSGLVLPAVTLAFAEVGFISRFIRSSVIDAATQKHVVVARAKGIPKRRVLRVHILRNALLPTVTILGLQAGSLIAGTVIVETVFSRQGIGRLLIDSILGKDYQTVQAVVLLVAGMFVFINFVVDMLYPLLDPRVERWQAKG